MASDKDDQQKTMQILYRIHEDNTRLDNSEECTRDPASLLRLPQSNSRVNCSLLWKILEKYGIKLTFLDRLKDLHETRYKVKGNKEKSSEMIPKRGLREGCHLSPLLYNFFHQIAMRGAEDNWKPKSGVVMRHNEEKKETQ